tara:strand:- start:54032 stop:54577 length:546 start_codon:yes stop_codon:yes gene_type:complete
MKKIAVLVIVSLVFLQCKKENNFTIAKNQLGKLTSMTQVNELKELFASDSLVSKIGEGAFASSEYDEYLVYDKKGAHMLTIIPEEQHDSTSTIESIQIFDERFKSVKGLGLASKFEDIVGNYTVNKVESTFTTVVLFIDELDVTIAIDKKELGIQEFGTQKIRLDQIPDLATIKYFTIWFD